MRAGGGGASHSCSQVLSGGTRPCLLCAHPPGCMAVGCDVCTCVSLCSWPVQLPGCVLELCMVPVGHDVCDCVWVLDGHAPNSRWVSSWSSVGRRLQVCHQDATGHPCTSCLGHGVSCAVELCVCKFCCVCVVLSGQATVSLVCPLPSCRCCSHQM